MGIKSLFDNVQDTSWWDLHFVSDSNEEAVETEEVEGGE